jgi:hypothetical protein
MILDRSGRGMRISTPSFVDPGTPVRLDLRNEVVLAEVCYCQPLHGRFALGLEQLPSLKNLNDLSQLGKALTGRPSAPAPRSAA